MTPVLTHSVALKEWAVAVDALAQGETVLLLRKGGIRDQGGTFTVTQPQFWLYPTYEHQKPHLLKARYANQVALVESGWHPETVTIQAWAEMTHSFQVSDAATVTALLPFHVWNEDFVTERLKWKARSPLSILLLRVYRLPQAQILPYRSEYGGCKSWIDLQMPLSADQSLPVLSEADYLQQVQILSDVIAANSEH